jgi:hypothetical protein
MKLNILALIRFFMKYGGPMGYLRKYGRILKSYGKAWDAGDIAAIVDHFHDEFIYTDPIAQTGITTKAELKRHLEEVFARFPKQTWTTNATFYPHFTPYKFAIAYEFKLAGKEPYFSGTGMEKIEFRGDKLIEDRIHLQFREMDSKVPLGFRI